tara:strand:- start:2196 stop:2420 length:225 start_codon:yes stop_codon:yes gene_type:complete
MVNTKVRDPRRLPLPRGRNILMQELEHRNDELGEHYEEEYQMLVLDEQEMSKDAFDNMDVCEDVLEAHNYGEDS